VEKGKFRGLARSCMTRGKLGPIHIVHALLQSF